MSDPQVAQWVRWVIPLVFVSLVGVFGAGVNRSLDSVEQASIERYRHQSERIDQLQRRLDAKRGYINGLTESVARISEQIDAHDIEAKYWKNVIDENRKQIYSLKNRPDSRPDAFTGSEGKELERRIDVLERCCDKMGGMK